MTAEEEIRRGERAEMLLRDDVLLAAFRELKEDCTAALWASEGAQHEVRERLYHLMKSAEAVKLRLEDYVAKMQFHKRLDQNRAELVEKTKREEQEIAESIDLHPKYFLRD